MTIEDQIAPINPSFHRAVEAEMRRAERNGYMPEHDDQEGIDHLLRLAYEYLAQGSTVRAGFMIVAARGWVARNEDSNIMQRQIAEFMRRADQAVALYPQLPEEKVKVLRIRLMVEELLGSTTPRDDVSETESSWYAHLLVKNKSDELIQSMLNGDLTGIADGIADVLYVVIGTAIAYGINIKEVFDEVHRSNLSKTVWSEELQRYTIEKDEFGKGIKPPTYSPAALEPIVQRQISEGKVAEFVERFFDQENRESIGATPGFDDLNDQEAKAAIGYIWDRVEPTDPNREIIKIEVPDNA